MSVWEPIGRDEARELARRELEKPIYHQDEPSLVERMFQNIGDWIKELFNKIFDPTRGGSGGGWLAVVVIILVIVAAVGLVFWAMRGRRNTRSDRSALLAADGSAARDHRAEAVRHAADGRWAEAIRERLRAVARDLEERVILEPRPGRTADELAAEAAQALPDIAEALHSGVGVFDDVWYGDRPGTREGYEQLTVLDELTQAATPRPLEPGELADANLRSPQ
ncbi:DUF4129 domain-containing protein [Actinomadura alba]|uniref:DUF4129 domain-containing protein n=1 Tax=Actinomadura alba TaxID=406431 RepID=A0ABR7LJ41_9ACTN|nr:DUF4129 domain-containing protein [Actinomadura alba]MBC6464869.1 DUF4129 domain-containing protein [Actinomadura alba]